jgi:putative spermidine/putrescine transport system permease protein
MKTPVIWRLLDAVEALAALVWPRRLHRFTGWLMLAPALLLVGLLVVGLVYMGDSSLRLLDTETFEQSTDYSLDNYRALIEQSTYLTVFMRSTVAALLVTAITLVLAFPYAYLMVRTRSSGVRKFLLISLFLPFFIGQVVRAYGWLIVLGREGILNNLLGLAGFGPYRMIYNTPSLIFGLVQYMLPFAVLLIAPAVTAIEEELELASESLGADWMRTFVHVTLPLARPGLVAAAVVVFALTLTDYAMPVVLGGGTNDFIANAVYDAFFRISDNGLGSALAIALVLFGSTLVGFLLTLLGAGTLGMSGRGRG